MTSYITDYILETDTMYYVFEAKILTWKGAYIQANIQNPLSWEESQSWLFSKETMLKPWPDTKRVFEFEVRDNVPHPDNYWTGANLNLYSYRLVSLLKQYDIPFEEFGVEMISGKTKQVLPLEYKVCRLLKFYEAIDVKNSTVTDWVTGDLKLLKEIAIDQKLLFREKNLQELSLTHEKLKQEIITHNITGCEFIPVEEFRVGFDFDQ